MTSFQTSSEERANESGLKGRKEKSRSIWFLGGTVTQTALFQRACSPLKGALKSLGVCGGGQEGRGGRGWVHKGDNLRIEMLFLPLPALHPLDSERPFFSAATKGAGSDCAGAFSGPLCFQMVLFSCDTETPNTFQESELLCGGAQRAGGWCVGVRGERGGLTR